MIINEPHPNNIIDLNPTFLITDPLRKAEINPISANIIFISVF